jgi:hypothetical protein
MLSNKLEETWASFSADISDDTDDTSSVGKSCAATRVRFQIKCHIKVREVTLFLWKV